MNPFAALAAAGVPLALGSDSPVTPFDPWGAVGACAFHHEPAQRVSVQAAFVAHTQGGWRAAGHDGAGVLAPGSAATYAVWEPNSGTPGLPDLSPGARRPTCLRTVVNGVQVHPPPPSNPHLPH